MLGFSKCDFRFFKLVDHYPASNFFPTNSAFIRQSLSWSLEPGEVEEIVEVEAFDLELFIYHNLDYELLNHVTGLRYLFFEVERVQISCWEGSSRPEVDPPCCRWTQTFFGGRGTFSSFPLVGTLLVASYWHSTVHC